MIYSVQNYLFYNKFFFYFHKCELWEASFIEKNCLFGLTFFISVSKRCRLQELPYPGIINVLFSFDFICHFYSHSSHFIKFCLWLAVSKSGQFRLMSLLINSLIYFRRLKLNVIKVVAFRTISMCNNFRLADVIQLTVGRNKFSYQLYVTDNRISFSS